MSSNAERSHYRYVSTLSYWARRVRGVRHLDLDLYQYCPRCFTPEVFFEVKPATIHEAYWQMTRKLADDTPGSCALLVAEPHDVNNARCTKGSGCPCNCHTHARHDQVTVVPYRDGKILEARTWNREQLVNALEWVHGNHQCKKR